MTSFTRMLAPALVAASLLTTFAAPSFAQSAMAKAVLNACKPDIKAFCSTVAPGNGRIKACMKQHLPELSEPCKEALFQAWLTK